MDAVLLLGEVAPRVDMLLPIPAVLVELRTSRGEHVDVQVHAKLAGEVDNITADSRLSGQAPEIPEERLVGLAARSGIAHDDVVGAQWIGGFHQQHVPAVLRSLRAP